MSAMRQVCSLNSYKHGRDGVRGSSVFDQFSNNVGVNGFKERLYCQTLF